MATATRLLPGARGGGGFAPGPSHWVALASLLSSLSGGVVKHASNPVLPKGTAGAWDDWGIRELGIVVDEFSNIVTEADGQWGYYWGRPDGTTGTFQIGLAKSPDGVTWTRYASNPVLAPAGTGWYQSHVLQPSVVKQADGTRVMMAIGRDTGGVARVGVLTSANGLSWTDGGQKLLMTDFLDGATSIAEIGVPSLIKRAAGDWLCLLECRTTGVVSGWRIYGATATTPTGTWTPLNSGQPIMSPTGVGWESVGVANPHIVEAEPGQYLVIYNGTSLPNEWQVGVASGSNLLALTRHASNPFITKGASGQWDDQQTETSFLAKDPPSTSVRIYYQGFSAVDGSTQIGIASPP